MTGSATTDGRATAAALASAERRLRAQLDRGERQLLELESNLTGVMRDLDTIQEDRDGVRLVIAAIRADVRQTRRALSRVANSTYGRCISCGGMIPAERLDAIPTVERCARCV